ncbi:MAG: HAMP domain-containing sensor histidine kinase [Desulfuromonadales bacterium]
MSESGISKGFIVICDESDIVEQVIQNDFQLACELAPGRLITGVFDEECLEKALAFFDEARSNNSAFDWELIVPLTTGLVTLHCAAAVIDEKLLVIGASSRDSAIQFIEEMLRINNEQTNKLRAAMKDLHTASQELKRRDQTIYEEMTHHNNRLSAMQRELLKKNHELARLNQQKNYFLGMAAHDLRSPLGAIVSYCEYLLDEDRERDEADDRELVATISKSSEFMLTLINDLLDISRIESGKLNLDCRTVNLHGLISGNLELNRVLANKKQISIHDSFHGDVPETVDWDAQKIEQVLNNLIGNAIKFSTVDSEVLVDVSREETLIIIRIEDHGIGIPPEILEKLFTPFSEGTRLGTQGEKATGLGLAIARRIVEGHGGEIRVEQPAERGTRFVVALPILTNVATCTST